MCHSIESAHIVVDYHTARIHARTYSIIEHQGNTLVHKPLEVIVLLRILSLGDNDATHFVFVKRLADTHLAVILLVTLRHHDAIATCRSLFFNACQHRREIEVCEFWDDDPYDLHRLCP